MTQLIGKVIEFESSWYLVLGYNERLELLEVIDAARGVKYLIDVEA